MQNGRVALYDTLMVKDGATTGKAAFVTSLPVDGRAAVNEHVFIMRWHQPIEKRLAFYFIRAFALTHIATKSAGVIGGIRREAVLDFPFPLPPLAEQKRIVAKVDDLMALCDRLEAQLQEREMRHTTLARASLVFFSKEPTPANLELLFHETLAVEPADLRKTILTLAVQGKLVLQDSKDEPTSLQLKAIKAQKDELIRKNQIKKTAPSRAINIGEVDHDIPDSWAWVRFIDVCEFITDGTHQTPKYTESGRIFLSAQNIKPFQFMPAKHRFVSEKDYQGYIKNKKPEKGDVLLTRVGAGIGEAGTVDQDLDFAIYVSLGLIRPVRGKVFSEFITLWLNSPDGTEKSSRNTYGKGVSQGNLNLSLICNFLVPLPPLAEQRRIIAKVDQLMSLVDQYEAQLNASHEMAKKLFSAMVAELITEA
jgi:type I restriction enzyme S subunit